MPVTRRSGDAEVVVGAFPFAGAPAAGLVGRLQSFLRLARSVSGATVATFLCRLINLGGRCVTLSPNAPDRSRMKPTATQV